MKIVLPFFTVEIKRKPIACPECRCKKNGHDRRLIDDFGGKLVMHKFGCVVCDKEFYVRVAEGKEDRVWTLADEYNLREYSAKRPSKTIQEYKSRWDL